MVTERCSEEVEKSITKLGEKMVLEKFNEEVEKSITIFLSKKYPDYEKWQDVNDIPPVIKEEMLKKGKLYQPEIHINSFNQTWRMIFSWERKEVFTVTMTTYPFTIETTWHEYSEQERG